MYKNDETPDSARVTLKVDEISIHSTRILRRDSSAGKSSRIYHRSAGGVPFNWESQPGTPKHPRREEIIPPPTPPPRAQSFLPPIKYWADHHFSKQDNSHSVQKLLFWRKNWKKQQTNKDIGRRCYAAPELSSNLKTRNSDDLFANYFDGGFTGWVGDSSILESKTSSNGSSHQLKDDDEHSNNDHEVNKSFGCGPWNINGIMVRVVKRV